MKLRWLLIAGLALSVSLLNSCSKTPRTEIAACRSAALTTHPPPRVIDYASYDRAYWNEQKVEADVIVCMQARGWKYLLNLPRCVPAYDMSRQSACYYRNDLVARASRWITGTKPPEPPPRSFPVQEKVAPTNIVIAVDKDGNITWNGKPIKETELRARFLKALRQEQAASRAGSH